MEIELRCPVCRCRFGAPADTPSDCIVERMLDDGPWYALAEGETFEEMVWTALCDRGRILCPECRHEVSVRSVDAPVDAGELAACS
jgi:hypothetical protein